MLGTVRNYFVGTRKKLLEQQHARSGYTPEQIADALYRGILGRPADDNGLRHLTEYLRSGNSIEQATRMILSSGEFTLKAMQELIPPHTLPNLRELFPQYFRIERTADGEQAIVFHARSDQEFDLLEDWIHRYRYYDVPGVWGAKIDKDKKVSAALVRGLGANSCLELGCFTGAVLSLLKDDGVDVAGVDASHLAFVLAYPNVRDHMMFGDLLSLDLKRKFDVVLAMDILEHLNPVKFDTYVERIESLVAEDGYVYLNSPMFGTDDVFGTVFPSYLPEWKATGDAAFWHDLDCDALGWPKHGHLVWASPAWWEKAFAARGLVRDRDIERAIQRKLAGFFDEAPSRKCFFVLRRPGSRRRSEDTVRALDMALEGF